jgi:5-phospho-D-xylono-1,4-lactonase
VTVLAEVVRTVRGDLEPGTLGRTDYHEHLLMASPLLAGDELDDVVRSGTETAALFEAGIDALAELTPIGCGRDPLGVRAISERTGMHVVQATGVHRTAHYAADHWVRQLDVEQLAQTFVDEVTVGCLEDRIGGPRTDVLAGVIKTGIGYWSIDRFERQVLLAAADAHRRTGAPIVCHLELGSAPWEALTVLTDAGVAPDRIVLAHLDRNPDPELHSELAAAGVYLGYDGAGRTKYWPDGLLVDCLVEVAERGGAERLLLGGDVARRSSFVSYGGLPGMVYLPRRFVGRIAAAGGDQLEHQVLVANPARFFAFSPPRPV